MSAAVDHAADIMSRLSMLEYALMGRLKDDEALDGLRLLIGEIIANVAALESAPASGAVAKADDAESAAKQRVRELEDVLKGIGKDEQDMTWELSDAVRDAERAGNVSSDMKPEDGRTWAEATVKSHSEISTRLQATLARVLAHTVSIREAIRHHGGEES